MPKKKLTKSSSRPDLTVYLVLKPPFSTDLDSRAPSFNIINTYHLNASMLPFIITPCGYQEENQKKKCRPYYVHMLLNPCSLGPTKVASSTDCNRMKRSESPSPDN